MEDKVSKIYLYQNTVIEELSLDMHHAMDNAALDGYSVIEDLRGVPKGAYTALSDDPVGPEFDLGKEAEGDCRISMSRSHGSGGTGCFVVTAATVCP